MKDYPDTSFLCSIYRQQVFTKEALAYRRGMKEALHVTTLLEFEFLQSVRLQVWLHSNDRTKGCGHTEAAMMINDWEADIAAGLNVIVPYSAEAVNKLAGAYSLLHTAGGGHRTLDVLHVATAVALGARRFLTFDERQRKLAEAVGLKTPL